MNEKNGSQRDPFTLPPPTRGMRNFAAVVFFLLGAGLAALILLNPLSLPFLPDLGRGGTAGGGNGFSSTAAAPQTLYQCPMHPEVLEIEPGNCPVCGMGLVPVRPTRNGEDENPAGGGRKILYWYAPMDPTYTSDAPGLSPMGMQLVPKYADGANTGEEEIRIDPIQVQNMGVVSEPVRRTDLAREIRTVGILDFDADHVSWINVKFSGWIEQVYVNYVGQEVRAGQPLFEIYSPELVTTQEEFLRALEYRDSLSGSTRQETLKQAEDLLVSARHRLSNWDISPVQIEGIEQSGEVQRTLRIDSPVDGVVVKVMEQALEGMLVKPGMNLYKLADLSSIWVHADVYETDLSWVQEGQPADVELSYFPGETFHGEVLYLYPELNEKTRTVKVCVKIPNPQGLLRPGMYANVRIKGEPLRDVVVIPDSAILRSGERNIVFLDLGQGRYRPQEIELGVQGRGDLFEVRRGLSGDERVVVQAQFMLDSESRVQEAIRKMRGGGKAAGGETRTETPTPTPPSGHIH